MSDQIWRCAEHGVDLKKSSPMEKEDGWVSGLYCPKCGRDIVTKFQAK